MVVATKATILFNVMKNLSLAMCQLNLQLNIYIMHFSMYDHVADGDWVKQGVGTETIRPILD